MNGSNKQSLKENKMIIMAKKQRSIVKVMCSIQLNDRKRAEDLMLMWI